MPQSINSRHNKDEITVLRILPMFSTPSLKKLYTTPLAAIAKQ
jgi:hypothetical protein